MPHAMFACMTFWNSTIFVMHTSAYKRNEKVHFNCIWTSGRGLQLVCCTIFLSQLSLNVFAIWELSIQYSSQIFVADFRFLPPMCQLWGDCMLFALLALNVIQFCCSWKYFHVILHKPDTQIKFDPQHFRKWELLSFNRDADRTIRTE